MTGEDQIDPEHFELRLPLWAVTNAEEFRDWGLPGALRVFVHDVHGSFLDFFTGEDIAEGYIRKAGFTNWRAVELATPMQVRAAALDCEQRGCRYIGLDCTGRRDKSGRFFTICQFLTLIDRVG